MDGAAIARSPPRLAARVEGYETGKAANALSEGSCLSRSTGENTAGWSSFQSARPVHISIGLDPDMAALALGCSQRTAHRAWAEAQIKSRRIGQSDLHLCFEERERISRGLAAGESARLIARELGRWASMIARELAANGRPRHLSGARGASASDRLLSSSKAGQALALLVAARGG